MTQVPQPTVTASKKEEMVIPSEQTLRAASEDTKSTELPTDE